MDSNKKDKVKEFFRKEGFFVALFICLCLVATVAAVTMKNNKSQDQAKNTEKEFSLNFDNNEGTQKQGADRVEGDDPEQVAEATIEDESEIASEEDVNVAAGTTTEVKFSNPIDGLILREFSYPKPKEMKDGSSRNIKGIDIGANVGAEVRASAEGVVEVVTSDITEGTYVIITHANGIKTKYANLDKTVLVKKGDTVTSETVIGNVGETSKIFSNKEFGEHINIQVLNSEDKQMDPTKYFSYKSE